METECYLDILPPELKLRVLEFCDGDSIISLSAVSKAWTDVILSCPKKLWWDICTKEIPIDFMLDILLSLNPKMWLKSEVDFSDIFASWHNWKNLSSNSKLHKLRVHNTAYEITTVQFSGVWIFIGTREGELSAVNIDSGDKVILFNGIPTFEIQLRRKSPEEITGALKGCDHDILILRLKHHYFIYDVRKGGIIEQYGKLNDFQQLKYFGPQEMRIYNVSYVTELISTCKLTQQSYSRRIFDTLSSILQMWNEYIVLLFDNGRVRVYDFQLREIDHNLNKLTLDFDYAHNRRLVAAHADVFFLLEVGSAKHVAGKVFDVIVGNKKQEYWPMYHLGAEVTSLLYHAGILFLGTADGFIHIFRVSGDEELLSLDLSAPLCQLNVTEDCTNPIISIALQEDTSAHFFLAAASMSDVFLISSHDLDIMP